MKVYTNNASLDPECEAAGKYTAVTFLSETYTILNSYDALHIEASDIPSDIGQYLLPAEQQVEWFGHAEESAVE
jgi:hypothetical protein